MIGPRSWFCENCNSLYAPDICEVYLSYFCPGCNIWLENITQSKSRPEKPSEVERGEMACTICKEDYAFDEKHDSKFCKKCDIWSEKKCPDRECEYCSIRPQKPSMAININYN